MFYCNLFIENIIVLKLYLHITKRYPDYIKHYMPKFPYVHLVKILLATIFLKLKQINEIHNYRDVSSCNLPSVR